MNPDYSLYFITDSTLTRKTIFDDAAQAIAGGVPIIQYREKNKAFEEKLTEAKLIQSICANKASFIINDDLALAKQINADGVHLGQEDESIANARKTLGKNRIIGVTVHNLAQAIQAEKEGADYLAVSPIFATATKHDAGKPCGTQLITQIRQKTKIPLIGIGGINAANISEVILAGANGAAVVSAICAQKDPRQAAENLLQIIKENKNETMRSVHS
ncbi:MAG: thiamine phosphate synthase [Candidatus Diapherotrites archaeon]|nr:thiamine phosphate synthase [Candidatus Diapherotrites archaeon]